MEDFMIVVVCCYADCLCVCLGVFISRGKEDALVTKNMVVGESVYGEKRISVEVRSLFCPFTQFKTTCRLKLPFLLWSVCTSKRSKLENGFYLNRCLSN